MKKIINLSNIVESDVRSALATKLSVLYYQNVLGFDVHLSIFAPYDFNLRPPTFCNQYCIRRFSSTQKSAWSKIRIKQLLQFMSEMEERRDQGLLIQVGKISTDISDMRFQSDDIIAARATTNHSEVTYANNLLHDHCKMLKLPQEELIPYDFSIMMLSLEGAVFLRKALRNLDENFKSFITEDMMSSILSCLAAHAGREGLSVSSADIKVQDIREESVLNPFYAI